MIELRITNKTKRKVNGRIFVDIFGKATGELGAVIKQKLGRSSGVVELILVGDCKIRSLNRDYRGKDKVTDVISFAYLEDSAIGSHIGGLAPNVLAGDIFISVPRAEVQARKAGHSLKKELQTLFVHGLLHLFGFDHNNDEEEEEMEKWARKIIS